jgi:putative addiction module CopG family antidote
MLVGPDIARFANRFATIGTANVPVTFRQDDSMTIALSPETQRLLDERLKSGGYATADEALRDALLLLELREREHEADFQAVKAKLERGAAQAERGELVDPDTVLRKIDDLKRHRAGKRA